MAFSINDMVKILFNRFVAGKSYTNSELSIDEEPFSGRSKLMFSDVWIDTIPTTNPLVNHNTYTTGAVHPGSGQQIVKKWHKLQLTPVTTSRNNKSFYYNTSFTNIIPSEYGDGSYQWELWKKDAGGNYNTKIPYGLYNWYFDPVNGVLHFLDSLPPGIDNNKNTPAITVYQYVGRSGSTSLLSSSGNVSTDSITIDKDTSLQIQVAKRYRTKSYVANKLNSNGSLVANTYTITHSLSTKFIDVDLYDNTSGEYVKVVAPWKAINNSQVEVSFSPSVMSGNYSIKVTGNYI